MVYNLYDVDLENLHEIPPMYMNCLYPCIRVRVLKTALGLLML